MARMTYLTGTRLASEPLQLLIREYFWLMRVNEVSLRTKLDTRDGMVVRILDYIGRGVVCCTCQATICHAGHEEETEINTETKQKQTGKQQRAADSTVVQAATASVA